MKQSRGLAVLTLIIMVIGMPIGFFWAFGESREKEKAYLERGELVTGTVVTVDGNGNIEEVSYKNSQGRYITASATLNRTGSLGETVQGYVLPEEPGEIFMPAGGVLKIIFYVLFAVLWLGSLAGLVMFLKGSHDHKLLRKKGLPVKAELVSLSRIDQETFGKFRFTAPSGQEYIKELPITHGTPFPGDSYDILYLEIRPGKCIAEVIDMRLV